MARLRVTLLVGLLLTSALVLSSCGSGGAVADARHSCRDVTLALAIQRRSRAPWLSSVQRDRLQNKALAQLLRATPSAAAATSIDGSWNALMTTINEAERVPIENLVPALTRLCKVADSSTPYL
ncbi:MAG TPA: hypothetical protein VND83_08615 [Acidimicrobiales bacterium]|nr:hypothetical protein [Acidimicrobiales bacterium]